MRTFQSLPRRLRFGHRLDSSRPKPMEDNLKRCGMPSLVCVTTPIPQHSGYKTNNNQFPLTDYQAGRRERLDVGSRNSEYGAKL